MAKPKASPVVAALILAAALFIVYGRALQSPFVFDDSESVAKNVSIRQLWPLVGDRQFPGPLNPPHDTTTSGRPLVNLSLAVNYRFGQLNPVGYHVFNLVVHLLSALLLMAIVRRTLCLDYFAGRFDRASGSLAFAVALLWAVHPLQTEAVIYVTQRTELMVGFFYLATLYACLRYWGADSTVARNTWLAIATLACLAGAASKEVMVTAPVVVLLFERTFVSGSFRQALQKSWPLYVGLFLSWALLLGLNSHAPRADSAGFHLGLPAYVWWLTQAKVLWMYLKLAVWPWPLSIHYGTAYLETLGAAWPWVLSAALLAIATLVLLWRHSTVGFVAAWVLLILSPTLVVPIVTEVAAERRMYLPLAALLALAVGGGYALVQQLAPQWTLAETNRRRSYDRWPDIFATIVALAIATVYCTLSFYRLAVYHDEIALWQDALLSQPDDFFVRYNLGSDLGRAGRGDEALEQLRESLRLNSNFPDAHYNLGNTMLDMGRITEAIEQFQATLWLAPKHAGAHNGLGKAYIRLGKLPDAIVQYQEALRLNPRFAEAHNNLGNALLKADRIQDALQHYELALQLQPGYSAAHANLAAALASLGRLPEAIEHYQEALRLAPDNFDALANLALVYVKLRQPAEAITAATKAAQLARAQGDTAFAEQVESWLAQYRAQQASSQPKSSSTNPAVGSP